jgi:hypothetical protein
MRGVVYEDLKGWGKDTVVAEQNHENSSSGWLKIQRKNIENNIWRLVIDKWKMILYYNPHDCQLLVNMATAILITIHDTVSTAETYSVHSAVM